MKTNQAQNRFPRLITAALMPVVMFSLIAVILVALGIKLPNLPPAFGSIPGFIGLILAGWLLGGLQTILYSVLMEFLINPRITNDRIVILISGIMLSMVTWSLFFTGLPLSLMFIGFISGCVVGYYVRDMYKYFS